MKPVCYVIPADEYASLNTALTALPMHSNFTSVEQTSRAALILLKRAVPVTDEEARRMLPQFYGNVSGLYRGRYCVDGHEFADPESALQADGEFPPFYIFDAETQKSNPFTFPTREEAAAWMLYASDPMKGPSRVVESPRGAGKTKTFVRSRHWIRVCDFIDQQVAHYTHFAKMKLVVGKAELLEYIREQHGLAKAEGYDDTATYIQHIIDDLEGA